MFRRPSATPCPSAASDQNRRDSLASTYDETTTTNFDFTTEFKASFRNVKPKRPATSRKRGHSTAGWTIHEDEEYRVPFGKDGEADAQSARDTIRPRHTSARRVSFARADPSFDVSQPEPVTASGLSKAPRRQSIRSQYSAIHDDTLPEVPSPKISKPARRGTIYIPSDNTTMPSMFMDMFSPLKTVQNQSRVVPEPDPEVTGLAVQMAQKRPSRKSMLATSPKRTAFRPLTATPQLSANVVDRRGDDTGKENIPPGSPWMHTKASKVSTELPPPKSLSRVEARPEDRPYQTSRLHQATASSSARLKQSVPKTHSKTTWNSNFLLPKPKRRTLADMQAQPVIEQTRAIVPSSRPPVPSRLVVPSVSVQLDHQYEFLPEGVAEVSMYEENWLGQQEIALTQLLNNLFETASPCWAAHGGSRDLDRLRLTEAYGSSEMAMLYKRIQGSLLYGAMGISKDVLEQGPQLYGDLGRRKGYVNLWLDNYEPQLLRVALEVIVGRVIPLRTSGNGVASSHSAARSEKLRPVQRFLEKFMIRNEDTNSDCKSNNFAASSYQRTVLRSLMLIKLLDLMKTDKNLQIQGNLFLPEAALRSSSEVSAALMRMLNPTAGDTSRPLKTLGYSVTHVQYPLEEFRYSIHNLAIDIRDGVRLVRLVELLLYRSASESIDHAEDPDATTMIVHSDGATLSLVDGDRDWPLSQHLKLPCVSRAAKLYNVDLALAALRSAKGIAGILHDITASDIVDGYREKTVRLLWGLSSKWGLGSLLDWEDINSEIKRLGRLQGLIGQSYLANHGLEDEDEDSYTHFKNLLKAWVKAVAATHGQQVRNFTTDFGDGRLFNTIVTEYQGFLGGCENTTTQPMSLQRKLRALGCSEDFAKLFAANGNGRTVQQIFDRDFVLASIAFLCSRLLRPSKIARAAVVVQRAWRKRWHGVLCQRKQMLKVTAASCAERARVLRAKGLIWKAWQAYQARRGLRGQEKTAGETDGDIWLSL